MKIITKRIFSILIVLCMLVGTIGVLPVSVFAADAATIVENGTVLRYSESEAEVSFTPTSGDFSVDWQYYYLVTANDTTKTADEVISGGAVSDFDENSGVATVDVTDLAEGVKYIHIVLVQKNDATQLSNVLKLTIPEYVPLTIVPFADGCEFDGNNTITVAVGTTVTFTTSESGCGMDYKEGSKVGPDLEFSGDEGYIRTATFSEIGTYTIEASINYKTAECTVIVVDELHQHTYSSEWIKDDVGHWHACNCGDMADYADHEFEAQDCEDGEKHRLICRYCGFQYRTGNLTSVFDHEYDNDCDSDCNDCGYERTVAPHSGTSCDICGWTFAQSAPTNLRWDTSNGTVAVWDAVDGATNYIVELWKKDIISLRLISHEVSDTSFEFYLTTLSPGSYYFTVRATCDDIKSKSATSDDIIMTSGGTPIVVGGVSVSVDSIDGTAYIVNRDDIADGSVSEVDMTPITVTTTLTNEQAVELINGWIASWEGYPSVDTYKDYIRPQLEDYSLADLEVIRNNIDRGMWPNDFIADVVIEEIEAREVTSLIIDPNYIDSNADKVTVNFGGTQAEMNNDALQKILDNLGDGENVKISVKDVGTEALPDSLTEKGAYGGIEAAIDKSIFKATGIENIEDRLKTLGLINGNTDSSVTEDEFEYLYHYLTTDELMALRAELNESAHFEHHQKAVEWLDKMIERDATVVDMSHGQLNISGILSKLEAIGYTGGDFTLGFLRQADLDMEHLEYIRHLMQQFVDDFDDSADELVLAWVKDAIAHKELEQENATITSMTVYGLKENADLTDKQMQILHDMGLQNMDNPSIGQIKKLNLTLEQLELLYAEIDRTSAEEHNPAYQGEYDVLLKWLEKAIAEKKQENKDTPTYINTSGTNDGINPLFIGAVDVNIGAVKADGTTTPIAIKADRSDAVAWSTNIGSAALEEMLAMLGAVTTEDVVSNIKAYKVLDNGTLEARDSKVTVNADGTLTLSAMSDGNSTYVFLYEPTKASEEHTHSGGTATCTEKAVCEICGTEYGETLGHDFRGIGMDENEHWSKCSRCDATGEKQAHTIDGGLCTVCEYQPAKDGLSTGAIVAIVIACVIVLAGGGFALYWFVFKKKKV